MDTRNYYTDISVEEVRNALKNKEFQLYYQPQVNTKNEIIAVEALARWFSEKQGMIPPNIFIPILEHHNLIYEFQNEMFDKACKQIIYLNKVANKKIKLSINISPIQLKNPQFINDIQQIMRENNIDPCYIELEITESYDLKKIKKINEILHALKQMNLTISLDDFGKGYNSIQYLLDFSFDHIKIDKKYIDKVTQKTEFLDAMIKMIHSVGSKVVAEGIEEREQVDILTQLNCDIMQGYYFYKPMNFNNLLKLV